MAKRLLVPIDGSEQAWNALDHATAEHPEAAFTLLYVINPVGAGSGAGAQVVDVGYGEEWYENAEHRAEDLFERARERVGDRDSGTETTVGRPARAIVAFAEENAIDGIVMGSHGRDGVSRVVLGSVAETVVRRSPVPVTVVR
jgi:nucleotide-binding universal stress UspA family protein